MLPKKLRLDLGQEFDKVVVGQKLENDLVKIFFIWDEDGQIKVGIAPPRQVFKRAVDRNRAKRLVATALQVLYSQLKKGLRVVVIPKDGVLRLKSSQLTLRIEQLLKKYGLLNNEVVGNSAG